MQTVRVCKDRVTRLVGLDERRNEFGGFALFDRARKALGYRGKVAFCAFLAVLPLPTASLAQGLEVEPVPVFVEPRDILRTTAQHFEAEAQALKLGGPAFHRPPPMTHPVVLEALQNAEEVPIPHGTKMLYFKGDGSKESQAAVLASFRTPLACTGGLGPKTRSASLPRQYTTVEVPWDVYVFRTENVLFGEAPDEFEVRFLTLPQQGGISGAWDVHQVEENDRLLLQLELPQQEDPAYVVPGGYGAAFLSPDPPTYGTAGNIPVDRLLDKEFAAALRDVGYVRQHKVIDYLFHSWRPFAGPKTLHELEKLSHSPDPWLAIHAESGLARRGSVEAARSIVSRVLRKDHPLPVDAQWPVSMWLCAGIGMAGQAGLISELIQLIESPEVDTWHKTTAISVVTTTSDPQAIPVLVRLLDSENRALQYEAVRQLYCSFATRPFMQGAKDSYFTLSEEEFREDADAYLDKWREWWEEQGRQEYGEAD